MTIESQILFRALSIAFFSPSVHFHLKIPQLALVHSSFLPSNIVFIVSHFLLYYAICLARMCAFFLYWTQKVKLFGTLLVTRTAAGTNITICQLHRSYVPESSCYLWSSILSMLFLRGNFFWSLYIKTVTIRCTDIAKMFRLRHDGSQSWCENTTSSFVPHRIQPQSQCSQWTQLWGLCNSVGKK